MASPLLRACSRTVGVPASPRGVAARHDQPPGRDAAAASPGGPSQRARRTAPAGRGGSPVIPPPELSRYGASSSARALASSAGAARRAGPGGAGYPFAHTPLVFARAVLPCCRNARKLGRHEAGRRRSQAARGRVTGVGRVGSTWGGAGALGSPGRVRSRRLAAAAGGEGGRGGGYRGGGVSGRRSARRTERGRPGRRRVARLAPGMCSTRPSGTAGRGWTRCRTGPPAPIASPGSLMIKA